MRGWDVPGYIELKPLGSGGFGEVVLARHGVTGTLVAIKYLRDDLLADPEFAQMFRAEATALGSLDDSNVVRLYEYVESPAGAAIVMELVDGVSLRDILARQGKTTAEAALVVLLGSLLGLAAAHRRGVVHRDYKPENVLVSGVGASKLTDFGIAARTGERPIPAGTLAYAAPEQMAGGPATPASDVYAAAATFYECLTGRPPFGGDTAETLLRQHRSEPVPLDQVPEPLRPLLAAGMAKDPQNRPGDASTLVTELETIASGAYGQDWAERGRSHLGEAALLLALLWPVGTPPAVQGTTEEQLPLHQRPPDRPARGRRPRRGRRISLGNAAIAIAIAVVILIVAAGTAIAGTGSHAPNHPSGAGVAVLRIPVPLKPSGPAIPMTVTSALAPVTGDVYVDYGSASDANVTVTGQISGVTSGEVAQLYAQPFPYSSAPASVASQALQPSGGSARYSFQVTPAIATRYQVELFRASGAATPLSTSTATTVYVAMTKTDTSQSNCSGGTCHVTTTISALVPPSALNAEMSKSWYAYLGLNLGSSGVEPPNPVTAQLGAGAPVIAKPQEVSANEFSVAITFTFQIGGDVWHAHWRTCTKDTEPQDGVGLPGAHGCGGASTPTAVQYLG